MIAYDRGRLVELFGDDPTTLAEVERDFLQTVRLAAREIGQTDDFTIIARTAHRLKGAAGMIGAEALYRIAREIEDAAKAEDLPAIRHLRTTFAQAMPRLDDF